MDRTIGSIGEGTQSDLVCSQLSHHTGVRTYEHAGVIIAKMD
jgi:hypothetical protein